MQKHGSWRTSEAGKDNRALDSTGIQGRRLRCGQTVQLIDLGRRFNQRHTTSYYVSGPGSAVDKEDLESGALSWRLVDGVGGEEERNAQEASSSQHATALIYFHMDFGIFCISSGLPFACLILGRGGVGRTRS